MSSSCSEEVDLLQDSKYRSYIQSVEKALKSFENTSEWADLISALGKLNKVLQSHKKYDVIPKKVTIGKRLAQCLHPALPAGVHLKAMETYDIIFKTIGTTRLAQDMFIYSAGLFPLLSFAAMNVRPTLLAVYENHFLPLGQSLRPGLTGLLMGVLPGLEEGSDHFDRTNSLLEEFCKVTDATFFYGCLWECVLSAPTIRLSAVSYVLAHYNRKLSMEDQLHIMGTNIDIMVQALCSAVGDGSSLVQRSALELLLSGFPMHNSQLTRPDMVKLLTSGIYVVLRRDMSLNRRLYAWLLGTDMNGTPLLSVPEQHTKQLKSYNSSENGETELHYFNTYSKTLLVQALKAILSEDRGGEDDKTENKGRQPLSAGLKPFRILISLLDKPEIGSSVVEDVLVEVFRCLHRECAVELQSKLSKKARSDVYREGSISSMDAASFHSTESNIRKHDRLSNELIKTANLFFGTFEAYFLWDFLTKTFESVCKAKEVNAEKGKSKAGGSNVNLGVSEFCSLASFLLDTVTLETYTETQTEYLPELLGHITTSITDHCKVLTDIEITDSLKLCSKILAHVLPSMTPLSDNDSDSSCEEEEDIFDGNSSSITLTSATPVRKGFDSEVLSREGSEDRTRKTDDECYESAVSDLESEKMVQAESYKLTVPGKEVTGSERKGMTPPRSPLKLYTSKHNADQIPKKPLTTMQACVQSFQTFFTTFSYHRITPDTKVLDDCQQRLMKGYENSASQEDETSNQESEDSHKPTGDQFKIHPPHIAGKSCSEAFTAACQLLIDFSSFPLYCTDHSLILDKTFGAGGDLFPPWLKILLACACYMDNFDIQAGAISAMLDLLTLTGSILDQCEDLARKRQGSISDGTVSVVIVPPLAPRVYRHINGTPKFYKLVAERLWCYLGQDTPNCHQKSVELFFQLHQLAPTEWVCEDVIGNALVSENEQERVGAHQKFAVLWHLTREVKLKPGMPQVKRTFERSLFVLLDSLLQESSPTKMLAADWLQHAIQRGDINRVLEPVLLLLLHPDTARISIQHVDIHQPRKVRVSESNDESDHEAKIYAISSVGGNVIYHISSDVKQVNRKTADDLRTSAALTTIGEKGTKIAPEKIHQDLFFEKVNPEAVNMFVNPFGSNTSLDKAMREGYEPPPSAFPDVDKVKRLDKDICQKEGITFDDDGDVDEEGKEVEEDDDEENNMEDVVTEIIEELLDQVLHNMEKDANSQGSQESLCLDRDQRSSSIVSKASSNDDLLNKIQSRISEMDSSSECDPHGEKGEEIEEIPGIHPLHTHILLYAQKYDCQRTLYALTILKSMISSNPKLFMCTIASTSISSRKTAHFVKLQNLLARHRKSVFGKNFFGDLTGEVATFRNSMYLEILISVCLYFVRSYYPNLMTSELSEQELIGNKEVQTLATEVLSSLLLQMISVVKESGRSFAFYATELLSKCKVQKAVLHCALSSVYNTRKPDTSTGNISFTDAIVSFNDNCINPSTKDAFQCKLLNVLLRIVVLEDYINKTKSDQDQAGTTNSADWDRSQITFVPQLLSSATFKARQPVAYQGMFLSAVLSGLKQQHMAHMHHQWTGLVVSCLPHVGKALPDLVSSVVCQLCKNLELLASEYGVGGGSYRRTPRQPDKIPPDHVITVLEGLTGICHFCLLDNTKQVSVGGASSGTSAQTLESKSSGQIFNNLIHVFNPAHSREPSPLKEVGPLPPVVEARRLLLSILPRVIAALTILWKAIDISEARENEEQPCWTMGSPKAVRQCILEFLSPISLYHGVNLLGAVAVVWNDRRKREAGSHRKVIPSSCEDQLLLVELISSVKVLPTDSLIQTLKQVIKSPPPTNQDRNRKRVPLEVSMLQFFYAYMERTPAPQLLDSWTTLLALFKEGLQLNLVPPGQFLLLGILHVFVHKIPPMESRKDHKDLQDIAQKLLEACSLIAGSSLEQTTWLRRNLAVKPGPQHDVAVEDHDNETEEAPAVPVTIAQSKTVPSSSHAQFSVQALVMLAETIASVLDIVYGSDEKDKVVPFLNANIMYHVFPYLKHHSTHNLPSLRACSQILCSLSGYQYTRKAWKKEAFELLLDPTFFQMDVVALQNWRVVIDNLMTHDKTSFRDLITRVSVNPSTAINIFSSKEQEFEQRAQLLKRLSFTIFCSELDQYARFMPEIQERLAENLRNSLVPAVQQQVFLCFRVLMLRMSPHHLTSLWPTMITELVHVFLQMEQELASDFEDRGHYQSMANLDATWVNGLTGHSSPDWFQLYLGACKLLDLALALPADMLPQFQLYRWAFVGDPGLEEEQRKPGTSCFSPHIVRLAKIMKKKSKEPLRLLKREPGRPLLTTSYIVSLYDLHGFFGTLSQTSQSGYSLHSVSTAEGQSKSSIHKSKSAPDMRRVNSVTSLPSLTISGNMSNKQLIEFVIEKDFVEPM